MHSFSVALFACLCPRDRPLTYRLGHSATPIVTWRKTLPPRGSGNRLVPARPTDNDNYRAKIYRLQQGSGTCHKVSPRR
jgi:hypothetical protein